MYLKSSFLLLAVTRSDALHVMLYVHKLNEGRSPSYESSNSICSAVKNATVPSAVEFSFGISLLLFDAPKPSDAEWHRPSEWPLVSVWMTSAVDLVGAV